MPSAVHSGLTDGLFDDGAGEFVQYRSHGREVGPENARPAGMLGEHVILEVEPGIRLGLDLRIKYVPDGLHEDGRMGNSADHRGRNGADGDSVKVQGALLTGFNVGVKVCQGAEYAPSIRVVDRRGFEGRVARHSKQRGHDGVEQEPKILSGRNGVFGHPFQHAGLTEF